ncbi:unnamed protein product [Leuciscus chuanchicus]
MWVFIVFFISVDVCGQADVFKTVQVKEGEVLRLHPGVDLKEDFQILWTYESGNISTRVAQIHQGKTYTHYDERFAERVQIDQTTGVLTISNIRTNETGPFEAFIVINKQISKQKFYVTVYGSSPTSNTTSTNQTRELYPPNKDCAERCGSTEALVRLVLSGLVGIAMVYFLVDHVRSC